MGKRIIFGLIGGLVMLLGFFEIQDYVPNTWGKTLDWLTEFDVWVVNNTASPSIFALGVGLTLGLVVLPNLWIVARRVVTSGHRPDLLLIPPANAYSLTWDPPESLQIITFPDMEKTEREKLPTRLPVFGIKNIGAKTAQSVEVKWSCEVARDLQTLIDNSPALGECNVSLSEEYYRLEADKSDGSRGSVTAAYAGEATSELQYVAPEIDNDSSLPINFPYDLWATFEIALVAFLSSGEIVPFTKVLQINLSASISWKHQMGTPDRLFRFIVEARNIRPYGSADMKINIDGEMRTPPLAMANVRIKLDES